MDYSKLLPMHLQHLAKQSTQLPDLTNNLHENDHHQIPKGKDSTQQK